MQGVVFAIPQYTHSHSEGLRGGIANYTPLGSFLSFFAFPFLFNCLFSRWSLGGLFLVALIPSLLSVSEILT
jgi:hypothetical protein